MLNVLSRILRFFPPERAHHAAIRLLKTRQLPFRLRPFVARAQIELDGLPQVHFPNRLGLAAGFDKNAEAFPALASLGFGFIEVGTVTPRPQPGNPPPRIFRVEKDALVNRLGFNNVGLPQFKRNLIELRGYVSGVPLWVNIGKGRDTPIDKAGEDYARLFAELATLADVFVVNVSSPNTKNLRDLQSEVFLQSLHAHIPEKPCFIKLAPDLDERTFESLCSYINTLPKISGVVLTNTSRALAEQLGHKEGGFSGPKLLPIALEKVRGARRILHPSKKIVGVGGVSSPADAQQMREAGADLVEIYTSFIYGGARTVRELATVLSH